MGNFDPPRKRTLQLGCAILICVLQIVPGILSQNSTFIPIQSSTESENAATTNSSNVTNNITILQTTVPTTESTSTTVTVVQPQSRTSVPDGEYSGILCESDNDVVGQRMGCSCVKLDVVLAANCAEQWIGYNETFNLPPKLNISIHVRILDLSKNYLKVLDENVFGDCEGVQELNLYRNQITVIKSLNCKRVKKLDLSWNKLDNLTNEAFANLSQLVELDLSHNNLIVVEPKALDQLPNLRVLKLGSNPLGQELNYFSDYLLSLDHLEHLEELDLSNTTIPDFPLSIINGTKNIKRLNLANNMIAYLPKGVLHELKHLEYLDLSGNWFETLAPHGFQGLTHLKTLVLDRMSYLVGIEQHAFAGLVNLQELSCQKNHNLSFIDVMAFRMAQELEKDPVPGDSHPSRVLLGDNSLNYFEYGLLDWKKMERLELHRNPWICDCNLQWVAEFHKFRPSEAAILQDRDFACMFPHIFAGVPVASVNAEEMLCYSEAATIAGTVGIIIFGFLLFTFCSIIILNYMGMLPDWVRKYNIFGSGSSLPKYMRVNPKPTRARRLERMGINAPEKGEEPVPGDLEWDTGDIGPTGPT